MTIRTPLMEQLKLAHPIIQAPMAGGSDTPELAAAVCNAGGMGFLGAAYLTPRQIGEAAAAVRARTNRPFGINLFSPLSAVPTGDTGPAMVVVAHFYAELGLAPPDPPVSSGYSFTDQLAAILDSGAVAVSFHLAIPPAHDLAVIKSRGLFLMGSATTVEEARQWEAAGADAVVAQGSEAGGHRGTFAGSFEAAMIGTMALVPQMVDAVSVPVVAAGGIMDGRGIAAALALGAQAAQMGTAFLTCAESGLIEAYRQAILNAAPHETAITRAFSGRPARGIVNRFMTEVEAGGAILPFPQQNALTRPLRTAAAKQGRAEFLSLWAGQGLGLARRQSTEELMVRLVRETEDAIGRLAR